MIFCVKVDSIEKDEVTGTVKSDDRIVLNLEAIKTDEFGLNLSPQIDEHNREDDQKNEKEFSLSFTLGRYYVEAIVSTIQKRPFAIYFFDIQQLQPDDLKFAIEEKDIRSEVFIEQSGRTKTLTEDETTAVELSTAEVSEDLIDTYVYRCTDNDAAMLKAVTLNSYSHLENQLKKKTG